MGCLSAVTRQRGYPQYQLRGHRPPPVAVSTPWVHLTACTPLPVTPVGQPRPQCCRNSPAGPTRSTVSPDPPVTGMRAFSLRSALASRVVSLVVNPRDKASVWLQRTRHGQCTERCICTTELPGTVPLPTLGRAHRDGPCSDPWRRWDPGAKGRQARGVPGSRAFKCLF